VSQRNGVRSRALLFTIGLVAGLGLLVQLLPGNGVEVPHGPVPGVDTPGTEDADGRAIHAGEMRKREIAARFRQAVVMLHAREYAYAVTALHRVLELAPRLPEAHANMGFALLGQEQYVVARDFFYSAIALRADQVNAYWGLALSLEQLCDMRGAIGAMRTYVHLTDPQDPLRRKGRSAVWEWETALAEQSPGQADTLACEGRASS
jgi:tetratricopeptide (TPR) repeat protein